MTQTAEPDSRALLNFLNTDGRPHPVENTVAVLTLLLGTVAALTAISPGLHLISSWAGLAGIASGVWGQLNSATTSERVVLVIGLGAAALGFCLGLANGGPFGGIIG
jgi:hypothetical protein